MGRSKFPGKPPKTVTRKRIKVLGRPEAAQSDTVTVAENIYYGLSLFNETFGENEEEHPPFHGFSSKEAKLSVSYVATQRRDADTTTPDKCGNRKDVKSVKHSPSNIENSEYGLYDESDSTPIKAAKKAGTMARADQTTDARSVGKGETREAKEAVAVAAAAAAATTTTTMVAVTVAVATASSSDSTKSPVLKPVNNILDRHQRTRQLRNSTVKRLLRRAKSGGNVIARNAAARSNDKSGSVRKFVLPIRSAHSSRVIKPNKRFIEELEGSSVPECSENENAKHAKKAKITSGRVVGCRGSKVSRGNVDGMRAVLAERETRRSRKTVPSGNLSGRSVNSTRDSPDTPEPPSSDTRKFQNSPSRSKTANKCHDNVTRESAAKAVTAPTGDPVQNALQNAKSNVSANHRQSIVSAGNLPQDSSLPDSESSRVQTRSGSLCDETSVCRTDTRENSDAPSLPETTPLHAGDVNAPEGIVVERSVADDRSGNDNGTTAEAANNSDSFDTESALSESSSERSDRTEDEQSEWTGIKLSGGKVILRKARLKLDNKNLGGTEGPFSTAHAHNGSNGTPNAGLAGTVKCGVCGAVRFYRFVKQARKFGIHSCESCRKFISKMIKRQACAESIDSSLPGLQCHKGDGLCLVPPVVRSQQWNLMRCVYKARCPACWLKMCLKCYNIPSALRTGLNALLPSPMRDTAGVFQEPNRLDHDAQMQKLTGGCKASWPAEESPERNLFKSATSWSGIEAGRKIGYRNTAKCLLGLKKLEKLDYPVPISPNKKRKKDNGIKVRKKVKNSSLFPPSVNPYTQFPRQRIELKGPRVKHVCRSASVALGQPIATFPSAEGKENGGEVGKSISKPPKEEVTPLPPPPPPKEREASKAPENNSNGGSNATQQPQTKRGKSQAQQSLSASNLPVMRSLPKPISDTARTISIDFWEQYDPAEVGAKGFALIGSEPFHLAAICYLCGSAGKEPLIHCHCCCEPYHAFCLEPSEWNACAQPHWCCPRCTVCQSCQRRSGPKLSCVRCRQSFHHSCLSKSGVSARLYSPDRPYICQSCIKCKSCGSEGVSVHVGNLPLCSMCFKLRQRGNYCPLCQRCYNENDFDTKMMECNECSYWVHARCEGLTDERYQILSYLPDSVEFTCRQCSPNPNSVWRSAIEAELKAGFIAVIKALGKNRKACAALKWSPRKECLCRPVLSARKLDFSNERSETSCAIDGKEAAPPEESEDCNSDRSLDTESSSNVSSKLDASSKCDSEFEERATSDGPRRGLRRLRQKFHTKDCGVVKTKGGTARDRAQADVRDNDNPGRESLAASPHDGGKVECLCSEQQIIARPSPTLMSVKRKVNGNEYGSLSQFHCDMEHVISRVGTEEIMEAYRESLREVFPWFDPKRSKVSSGIGGMSTPTKESRYEDSDVSTTKLNDSILETWKEEILRAPKAIAAKVGNLYSNVHVEDRRCCCLCKGLGDGQETKEGRLLYCGQNEWVHANCALWSNEVFEEIDGSLQNVHSAISRGRSIRCTECGKKGASVGCCFKSCGGTFHYPCARNTGLAFNDDKTVFCAAHSSACVHKTPQSDADFDLKRPVYVELDRKKKKYAEPSKVRVMIGSLSIDSLGTIAPEFSDGVDKLVPSDYKCSRLYWSTVNPLKIVRYHIRTYVRVYVPEVSSDLENNVTIDHSKEREREDKKLHNLERAAVEQTLDALIDSVCAKEVDETLAEQSNTDLLPPELKEAIFEDLPHDLLDGISMQDIFPKMTYEDFLAMDMKNDVGAFATELLKDDALPAEVDEIVKPPDSKISKMDPSMPELGAQSDLWLHLETKNSVQDYMDDLFGSKAQKLSGRELKRSKSEVMSNNSLVIGGQRHHQRSCSLTWSCKLDGTYGPTMKRRKLPRNPPSLRSSGESNVVTAAAATADSPNERASSMFHELRIPESIVVTMGRATTPGIIPESVRELKYRIDDSGGIGRRALPPRDDAKERKRLLWHARQQPRILQVDGAADASSASECSSPEYNVEERVPPAVLRVPELPAISQLDGANDESSRDSVDRAELFEESNLRLSIFATTNLAKPPGIAPIDGPTTAGDCRTGQQTTTSTTRSGSRYTWTKPNLSTVESRSVKIPQLDGADDISSDDECASPRHTMDERLVSVPKYAPVIDPTDRPVTCKRCRCTYRTQDSYDRHLSACDIVTTSDSDSETMDNNKLASPDSRFSPSVGSVSPRFVTMSPSEGHTLSSEYPDIQATSPIEASVPSPHSGIRIEPVARAIVPPQIHTHATVETVHQTVLTSNDVIVQTQYTRTTTTLPNATTVLPQRQESTVRITEITDPVSVARDPAVVRDVANLPLTSPDEASSVSSVTSPRVSPAQFSSTAVQTATCETTSSHTSVGGGGGGGSAAKVTKPKSPRAPRPRAKGTIKPQISRNSAQPYPSHVRYQPIQNGCPVIQLQQQPQRPPAGPTVILQQVASPGIMSAYVEALQQQSGQNLQYVATIGGQHESGFKPQFITTNQLVPGAYIQASSDNLLTLQNGGISVLPSVQIAQPQPTVLGTIIQQQPSAIQCGVISSEQLVLGSAPALEMFTDSTGSMFVSSQPMYYGLETIVSNTVMSSSQFVTGAVPQMLASSYQTTTQVFQASKLMDPIVDVQTVPAVPTVPAVRTVQGMPGVHGSYVVVNQSAPVAGDRVAVTPRIGVSATPAPPEPSFTPVGCDIPSPAPRQTIAEQQTRPTPVPEACSVAAHVNPTPEAVSPPRPPQQCVPTIPRVAVRPSPVTNVSTRPHDCPRQWKTAESIFGAERPVGNGARSYFDSKHVSENAGAIKSSVSSKVSPLSNHCVTPRSLIVNKSNHDVNNAHNASYNGTMSIANGVHANTNNGCSGITSVSSKMTIAASCTPTSRPMNRVLPMQAVPLIQDPASNAAQKSEVVLEEPTKPLIAKADGMDIVLAQAKKEITPDVESAKGPADVVVENLPSEAAKPNGGSTEKTGKGDLKLELSETEKSRNASLKIVLQKQLQDGSYKITHNMKTVAQQQQQQQKPQRNDEKSLSRIASVIDILPRKKPPQITSLQLLPVETFAVKANRLEETIKTASRSNAIHPPRPRHPPVAVKKPRYVAKPIEGAKSGPPNERIRKKRITGSGLMYEIKSQDGFTYTASSMSEVWDTIFKAVQTARKAHNLPPLPHNSLAESFGLENRATVYLIEQLPGANRCVEYKPKLHNLTPPKPGELENDSLSECASGAARAERFKGRKVHDAFGWLASRHRQQPKMIATSETESRRTASTNLPMAMRFRILKETSKESVGVYHSHIHGRGLFCLRDIEAGEMVIEYAGEVIRASLTDKREKYYDSKNIGCYMFKIDDHLVVDATMKGNAARFINHSCEPNCYSRVVDILGKKHILIFALRRIVQGEELTYDYKFPFEDIKIPCTCGSRRCRKYLN